MKKVFNYIISESVKRTFERRKIKHDKKLFDKAFNDLSVEFSHISMDIFFIVSGVLSASFGLGAFLLPNTFLDGGVTGISLITAELTGLSLSVLIVILNIPFIFIAFNTISRSFAIKSIFAILLLAVAVHFIPYPSITNDKLLISVFGGFFLGLGIGLAVRGGSVIDGTEVLAVFISKKTPLSIGDIILIFNIIIFSVAAYVFSIETALYAILTYLSASKTVDFIVAGIEEYVGVSIISEHNEEIRLAIIEKLGRACTIYSGKKGFAPRGEKLKETDIVYTLMTRLEISKLQTEIDKIDKDAFVIMHSVKDAKGGMIKKRPME